MALIIYFIKIWLARILEAWHKQCAIVSVAIVECFIKFIIMGSDNVDTVIRQMLLIGDHIGLLKLKLTRPPKYGPVNISIL